MPILNSFFTLIATICGGKDLVIMERRQVQCTWDVTVIYNQVNKQRIKGHGYSRHPWFPFCRRPSSCRCPQDIALQCIPRTFSFEGDHQHVAIKLVMQSKQYSSVTYKNTNLETRSQKISEKRINFDIQKQSLQVLYKSFKHKFIFSVRFSTSFVTGSSAKCFFYFFLFLMYFFFFLIRFFSPEQ